MVLQAKAQNRLTGYALGRQLQKIERRAFIFVWQLPRFY